ncbi:MAG: flagellar motor switch protein FliN [Alphaproteobacteria bacterium]|nr:flagellar motor switch protein FliN [Alphaproteobacteria bacterium]
MSDDADTASPVEQAAAAALARSGRNSAVQNISVDLTAVLGTADMKVSNLLKIGRGAVIELDRRVGDTVEVRCNGMPIGRGEVVVVEDHLAVSITEMYKSSNQAD